MCALAVVKLCTKSTRQHGAIWGPRGTSRVTARPVVRIWPLDRIGAIEKTEDLNPFRRQALQFREALEEAIRRPAA